MDHDLVDKANKSKKPASRLMKAKLAAAKVDKQKPQLDIQAQLEIVPTTSNTSIKEEGEAGHGCNIFQQAKDPVI